MEVQHRDGPVLVSLFSPPVVWCRELYHCRPVTRSCWGCQGRGRREGRRTEQPQTGVRCPPRTWPSRLLFVCQLEFLPDEGSL